MQFRPVQMAKYIQQRFCRSWQNKCYQSENQQKSVLHQSLSMDTWKYCTFAITKSLPSRMQPLTGTYAAHGLDVAGLMPTLKTDVQGTTFKLRHFGFCVLVHVMFQILKRLSQFSTVVHLSVLVSWFTSLFCQCVIMLIPNIYAQLNKPLIRNMWPRCAVKVNKIKKTNAEINLAVEKETILRLTRIQQAQVTLVLYPGSVQFRQVCYCFNA